MALIDPIDTPFSLDRQPPFHPPSEPGFMGGDLGLEGGNSHSLGGFDLSVLLDSEPQPNPNSHPSPVGEANLAQTVQPNLDTLTGKPEAPLETATTGKSIVFIDSSLQDVSQLMSGVAPGAEVVVLESRRDGVSQISEVLAARSNINSVHIISYGSPGSVQLGAASLSLETLEQYREAIASWSNALSPHADLLIYSCNVTADARGQSLIQQLSQLTRADVAASSDRTGNADLDGDWDLETTTGPIESPLALTPATLANYRSVFDTLSISGVTLTEGNLGAITNAIFNVNLARTSNQVVSVAYTTANGSATAPSDYQSTSGTLVFGASETQKQIIVPVFGDNSVETNENFTVNLTAPSSSVTIGVAQATATLLNDDQLFVSISNATVAEGNTGTNNASITVNLSEATNLPVTVNYLTATNGSATTPGDFQTTAGIVTFNPGEVSKTITVPVVGDVLVEQNETFLVQLSNVSNNATLSPTQSTATVTIVEDDQLVLSVNNVTLIEGDTGSPNAAFTVSLSAASNQAVSVNYSAVSGTATSNTDFTPTTGTINFSPGETLKTVTVPVLGDTNPEADETFLLQLANPTGAILSLTGSGTATIRDDDLSISGTKWEDLNNNGTRDTGEPVFPGVTIYLDLNDNGEFDSATDRATVTNAQGQYTFTDLLSGSYVVREIVPPGYVQTFPQGEQIQGGAIPTPAPTLNITNATLATAPGDGGVSLQVNASGAILDGASYDPIGTGTTATTTYDSDVAFRVGNSGARQFLGQAANSAGFTQADSDSTTSTFSLSGLTFGLNQTVQDLLSGSGSRTGSVLNQIYTITNPGTAPVTFELLRYFDGDLDFDGSLVDGGGRLVTGGQEILFETDTAGLPVNSGTFVGITANGGTIPTTGRYEADSFSGLQTRILAGTALDDTITGDGTDADQFVDAGQGYDITLAFRNLYTLAPGSSTTYITRTIFGTGVPEELTFGEEGFYRIALESGQPQTGVDFGNFQIPIPNISIEDTSQTEGTGGSTGFEFRVRLDRSTIIPVQVSFSTTDQSAVAGSDYTATTGTITFSPGETEKIITIPVTGDDVIEPTETFQVNLTGTSWGNITDAEAIGTILDDDLPVVRLNNVSLQEGNSGTTQAVFNVSLTRPGIVPATVNYQTQDGTATSGSDYQGVNGSLTFAVGETQKTIVVPIIGDTVQESDENFFVLLSGITNATPTTVQALGTILNDEVSQTVPPPSSPTPATPSPPPVTVPSNPEPEPLVPTSPTPTPTPNPLPAVPQVPGVPTIPSPNTGLVDRTSVFDLIDYAQFFANQNRFPNLDFNNPITLMFDESYYLATNPIVAQQVALGNFQSGYDHFIQFGQFEGRDPSALFSTSYYLSQNPEVAAAVGNGTFRSAFQHFIQFGLYEGRDPNPSFNNALYLNRNPAVQQAIQQGALRSGFEHYLKFGQFESQEPRVQLFDEAYYLAQNPAVAQAVASGLFPSGFAHYIQFGQLERRNPSALFDENFYLAQNPAVAQAVAQGNFRSGFEHYLLFGRAEGRAPRPA